MTERTPFFVTTAISYPNGAPHIGHAYEALATDAIARFQRLDGRDVFFLTGTDEHGQKMLQTARAEGIPVQDLAERNATRFREMVGALGCSNDDFIRTSEPRHHAASQEIWRRMEARGDIYKDSYSGWYSVRDEAYYQEGETELRADGVRYGPQGSPVEWVEEESYFFRLSDYQERLLAHYEANPDFIGPDERRNEIVSFVKRGLKDLSISRTTFDWGVKVPGDERHVMYVWVDALTNYITAAGFPDETNPRWRYWPADLHVIGKDIVRFHAVYWPAFLMSAGIALPKRVYAHGFLFNRGEKMSKSVGNVIDPFALVDHYGLDQVRYFFLREVPFGQDGNYSHDAIVNRINADLANDLGNLAQRSLSMIAKNCEARLPQPGAFTAEDEAILAQADTMLPAAREAMSRQAIHQALSVVWACVAEANRYFAGQEPWALKKSDPARMGTVLYVTAEVIRQVSILAQPVIPGSASRLLDLLALDEGGRDFASLGSGGRLVPGRALPKPEGVFPRYVEAEHPDDGGEVMLVDSHCHLDFPDFDAERDEILRRAGEAGVGLMVTICTRVARFDAIRALAESHDNVFCSVGTHPHNAGEDTETGVTTADLVRLAQHEKVVAIGEAGLDYFYDKAPREAQAQGLRRHIAAARESGLPLVIHSRDADDDMAAILRDETEKGAFPALLHCFSSGRELAMTGIELGLYVSFSGIVTFKRSDELRAIAAELPADRLLVETDAPYLAPQPWRGKRNEPAYVAHTNKVLAETRGVAEAEMARQTTENFFRLFSRVPARFNPSAGG